MQAPLHARSVPYTKDRFAQRNGRGTAGGELTSTGNQAHPESSMKSVAPVRMSCHFSPSTGSSMPCRPDAGRGLVMAAFHPCTIIQATFQTYAKQYQYVLQQMPHICKHTVASQCLLLEGR